MSKNKELQTQKPDGIISDRPSTEYGRLTAKQRERLFLTHEYSKRRFELSKDNDGFLEKMLERAKELASDRAQAFPTLFEYLRRTWPESQCDERAPFILLNYITTYHELGIASYRYFGVEDLPRPLTAIDLASRPRMKDEEFGDWLKETAEKFDKDDLDKLLDLSVRYRVKPACLLTPVAIKDFLAGWLSKNKIFSVSIEHEKRAPCVFEDEGDKDDEKFVTLKIPKALRSGPVALYEVLRFMQGTFLWGAHSPDDWDGIKTIENLLEQGFSVPFRQTKDSFRNRLAGLYVYDLFMQTDMPKKLFLKEIRKNMSEILCSNGVNGQNCNECPAKQRYSCADKLNKEFCKAFAFITNKKEKDLNFNKIQEEPIRHIGRINYYDFWQGKPRS